MIQFRLNNVTKSSPINFLQYDIMPYNMKIVSWPQITVTSLQPIYNNSDYPTSGKKVMYVYITANVFVKINLFVLFSEINKWSNSTSCYRAICPML